LSEERAKDGTTLFSGRPLRPTPVVVHPPFPVVPPEQRGRGTYRLRFEDLAQDGRILFEPIVASIGAAVWRPLLSKNPMLASLQASGVRPIFTRLVLVGTAAALDASYPLTADGAYELAYEPDLQGGVARIFLNMWTEIAWEREPEDGRPAERVIAGRMFGEHVLTRLHPSPEQRRVTEIPGLPQPTTQYRQPPREDLLGLPAGASWLEPAPRADAAPLAFGLFHTDPNHHVNSLVYPRVFEEAALRRFHDLGRDTKVLGRTLEVAYRKPFFAGQSATLSLRAFSSGSGLGAAGVFEGTNAAPGTKPHAYLRISFEP